MFSILRFFLIAKLRDGQVIVMDQLYNGKKFPGKFGNVD